MNSVTFPKEQAEQERTELNSEFKGGTIGKLLIDTIKHECHNLADLLESSLSSLTSRIARLEDKVSCLESQIEANFKRQRDHMEVFYQALAYRLDKYTKPGAEYPTMTKGDAAIASYKGTGTPPMEYIPPADLAKMAEVFEQVCDVPDSLTSADVYGEPRMKPVLERLLDLQNVRTASQQHYSRVPSKVGEVPEEVKVPRKPNPDAYTVMGLDRAAEPDKPVTIENPRTLAAELTKELEDYPGKSPECDPLTPEDDKRILDIARKVLGFEETTNLQTKEFRTYSPIERKGQYDPVTQKYQGEGSLHVKVGNIEIKGPPDGGVFPTHTYINGKAVDRVKNIRLRNEGLEHWVLELDIVPGREVQ